MMGIIYFIININQNEKEEFVKVEQDGTKVNISNKLKEKKEFDGLKVENVQLTEKDGQSILLANVTNTTTQDLDSFFVDIILYDKQRNEIGTILGFISPVKSGQTVELKAGITEDYANVYDIKIVNKE
ncbi:MAG: hypothetical protein J6A04_01670 [Clostridia bacterium]|nr:hypothetical protein [Clostridia bacterium]